MSFYCDVKFVNSHSPIERMEFPRCPVVGDELVVKWSNRGPNVFRVIRVQFINNYDSNQIHNTVIFVEKVTDGLQSL